ncbi:MAG: type IV secretory system conjugative DNA transfer family protein, partial [[Bacteroides] pectinophilus]|nr:type IV secretory system conjugative DNA transfer family protein [[Bacteroides] pectinophilus]
MKGDYDRVILGRDAIYTTDCEVTGINNNILVCGGSGSGKTMSISEPCMLEAMNSSLVVTVTKRRIVDKYKQLFRSRGYVVEDMNYIDPEESTVSFDPIRYIKDCTDITYVARSIMLANPQKQGSSRDPYWDEAAASLLCAEISYVIMTNEKATFADVIDTHMRLKIAPDDEGIKTT